MGDGGSTVLFWPRDFDETDGVIDLVSGLAPDAAFTVVAFRADWDRELTPWPAENVFKGRRFGGEGRVVLDWLEREAMPAFPAEKYYIGGYSLGGLFALWAYCECGRFCGAASASGSLWYPGWRDYAERAVLRQGSRIYLSLGDREEKTRNPVMAQVGDCTRAFRDKCAASGIEHLFEWTEGNHFREPDKRAARAFAWLIR